MVLLQHSRATRKIPAKVQSYRGKWILTSSSSETFLLCSHFSFITSTSIYLPREKFSIRQNSPPPITRFALCDHRSMNENFSKAIFQNSSSKVLPVSSPNAPHSTEHILRSCSCARAVRKEAFPPNSNRDGVFFGKFLLCFLVNNSIAFFKLHSSLCSLRSNRWWNEWLNDSFRLVVYTVRFSGSPSSSPFAMWFERD